MSNPVFSKMERDWSRADSTPAGYPTMPGYQPTNAQPSGTTVLDPQRYPYAQQQASAQTSAQNPYGAPSGAPAVDPSAYADMQAAYQAPSADAVDRGRMTYDDALIKTGITFLVLLLGAAPAWILTLTTPLLGLGLALIGGVLAFILAMVNSFSKTIRPALIIAYAFAEGLTLGALSAVMEMEYPGIVAQAFIASVVVTGLTLVLFASGKVRNSPKLMKFTLIGIFGLLITRLANAVLVAFGLMAPIDSMYIMGIPLGIVVSVVAVFLAAMSLISDFDTVKQGVERGAPAKFAWYCAFGIMVTVVWMYMEILRILAILNRR